MPKQASGFVKGTPEYDARRVELFGRPSSESAQSEADRLRAHVGKRIRFTAGRQRVSGVIKGLDRFLVLEVVVDEGPEAGTHFLELKRLGNYNLQDR